MTKRPKATIIYCDEDRGEHGVAMWTIQLVGDKPSEDGAKRMIKELLKYVKKIRRIE